MESVLNPTGSLAAQSTEDRLYRRVAWRLVPFLALCYVVGYLDRVNVGFAKLQMLQDLHFSETVYGLGASIFFVGYLLFEIPSNIILHRVGARRWIGLIMVTWGFLSSAMIFATTPNMFYLLRFLLGVAEAGFFPGVVLYLTYWFPDARRGRITGMFMTAIPLSGLIGGPVSGWIMLAFNGEHGLAGWQWLFLLEGLPAVILGFLVFFWLDDRVSDAKWLSGGERVIIARNIEAEAMGKANPPLLQAFIMPRVWAMAGIYLSLMMGLYGVSFWLPTLIRNTGVHDTLQVGLLSAVPNLFAIVAMVVVSRSSDRKAERRWHLAVPALFGAVGMVAAALGSSDTWTTIAALTLANIGICAALPLFWSMPTALLGGAAAAAGIALVNSISCLGGVFSPYLIGHLKDITGSTDSGLYMMAACMCVAAGLALAQPAKLVNR